MLTSEDLPETYRNVHSEDAKDGRTDRFSENLKKVLAGKNFLASLVQGTKMSPQVRSHKHTHSDIYRHTHYTNTHIQVFISL